MLDGLGVDLVEVGRIRRACDRWGERFLRRVFTAGERAYCMRKVHPEQSLAARFAAKEAVLKAIGTGLSGGIRFGDRRVLLTISHTKELAIAQAILLEK